MNIKTIPLFFTVLLAGCSNSSSGLSDAIGNAMDDVTGIFDGSDKSSTDKLEADKMSPSASEQPKEESSAPAQARIQDTFYGDIPDANTYEVALKEEDYLCNQIVASYEIDDNLGDILHSAVESSKSWLDKWFNQDEEEDPDAILNEAKKQAKQMNWMPMGMELQYGAQLHEKRLDAHPKVYDRGGKKRIKRLYEEADAILATLLAGLPADNPYNYKLFVTAGDEINAEAIPGGYLYITKGAVQSDYGELVLAHEIAHVSKRHTTKELQARLIDSVDTFQDLKDLLQQKDPDPRAIARRAALLHGLFLRYSRQQELQADACGVRIVSQTSDKPVEPMIESFIEDLEEDAQTSDADERKASLHPTYPERRERMLQASQKLATVAR